MFPQKLVFPDGKTFHQQNADPLQLQPGHGDEATQLGKELKGSWRAARLHRIPQPRLRAGSKDPTPPRCFPVAGCRSSGRSRAVSTAPIQRHPEIPTPVAVTPAPSSPQTRWHPVMCQWGADTRGPCSPKADCCLSEAQASQGYQKSPRMKICKQTEPGPCSLLGTSCRI